MITSILPAGATGWLIETESLADVVGLHARLASAPLDGQTEALPAARTLLLTFRSARAARAALPAVERSAAGDITQPADAVGATVDIDVVYDGADLAAVAEQLRMSTNAVVDAHTRTEWVGAFGGFAPGFTYCTGESGLRVGRRATPRTAVPAGAVGLAGEFTAVYPRTSPGGWQLIGHTEARLWDSSRQEPALIAPGDRVRFHAVREHASGASTLAGDPEPACGPESAGEPGEPVAAATSPKQPDSRAGAILVEQPGLQAIVEDLGRVGYARLGVSPSGAADSAAFRQANRLVGNPPDAAAIENVFGRLQLTASGDQVVAITGAVPAHASADGSVRRPRPVPLCAPFALFDGESLEIGPVMQGLRLYVAVRGGIDVDPVLNSRSTDTLSGLGPAVLTAGARLPIGPVTGMHTVGGPEPSTLPAAVSDAAPAPMRITFGPRADWFTDDARNALLDRTWTVSDRADRIGIRLTPVPPPDGAAGATGADGEPVLTRRDTAELPSEGVVTGALQVPPDGMPVLFLADRPVTGGYPVIAVVHADDVALAAQLPPGRSIRFEGAR